MSKRDRKNGVPETVTSIPLVDPHAMSDNPSIGDLVKDATAQMSTLVRAEVELAKAEITRDVKKGLTGSVFFIVALVVLLYSTFFMFFFLAELLDTWLWRWAAFLIVFLLMLLVTAVFAFLGYRKVRRIRGPQQTIESVKETTAALAPGLQKFTGGGHSAPAAATPALPATPATPAWAPAPRPSVAPAPPRQAVAPAAPVVTTEVHTEPTVYAAEPTVYVEESTTVYAAEPTVYVEESTTYTAEPTVYAGPTTAYSDETIHYEPATYSGETAYSDEAADDAPASYAEQTVVYAEETTVYYDEPTGPIPPVRAGDDDPTAAIYADTGQPVTPDDDRRPGNPSGW